MITPQKRGNGRRWRWEDAKWRRWGRELVHTTDVCISCLLMCPHAISPPNFPTLKLCVHNIAIVSSSLCSVTTLPSASAAGCPRRTASRYPHTTARRLGTRMEDGKGGEEERFGNNFSPSHCSSSQVFWRWGRRRSKGCRKEKLLCSTYYRRKKLKRKDH